MKTFFFSITVSLAIIAPFLRPPNANATTVDVTVAPNGNLVFSPSSVTIHPGDTVRWTRAASFHSST
jgi:plastocyanin